MRMFVLFSILLITIAPNEATFLDQLKSSLGTLAQGLAQTFSGVATQGGKIVGDVVGKTVAGAGSLVGTGVSTLVHSLTSHDDGRRELRDFTVEIEKKIQDIIQEKKSGLFAIANAALTKLQHLSDSLGNIEFLKQPISKVVDEIDDIIASHHLLSDAILDDIIQNIKKSVNTELSSLYLNKTLTDIIMDHIDTSTEKLLKPHTDLIKQAVTTIGLSLKSTVTNLMTVLQKHMSTDKQNIDDVVTDLQKILTEGQNLIRTSGQRVISAMADKVNEAIVAQHRQN